MLRQLEKNHNQLPKSSENVPPNYYFCFKIIYILGGKLFASSKKINNRKW